MDSFLASFSDLIVVCTDRILPPRSFLRSGLCHMFEFLARSCTSVRTLFCIASIYPLCYQLFASLGLDRADIPC